MSIRQVKDRVTILHVENDLRGLGGIVNEQPPQYELHIQIEELKSAAVMQLATSRGFHMAHTAVGSYLCTREQLPHHEQAVWHFFMAVELLQRNLIPAAEIFLTHPIENLLLTDKHRQPRPYTEKHPTSVLLMDASIAIFMMKAGHWRNHFKEADILKDISSKGYCYLNLSHEQMSRLVQEISESSQSQARGELRNAR